MNNENDQKPICIPEWDLSTEGDYHVEARRLSDGRWIIDSVTKSPKPETIAVPQGVSDIDLLEIERAVWKALDRMACPGVYMQAAAETVLSFNPTLQPSDKNAPYCMRCGKPKAENILNGVDHVCNECLLATSSEAKVQVGDECKEFVVQKAREFIAGIAMQPLQLVRGDHCPQCTRNAEAASKVWDEMLLATPQPTAANHWKSAKFEPGVPVFEDRETAIERGHLPK